MNIKNTNTILSNYIKSLSDPSVQNVVDTDGVVNLGKALNEIDFSDGMYNTTIGAGSIADKILKTEFYSAEASNTAPQGIFKNEDEWGTFTEVIRVDAGDYYKNLSYDGNGSGAGGAVTFDDIFGDYNPTVDAKYFHGLDTDEIRYSIKEKQWNAAFKSEQDFNRFVSQIHNAINVRRNMRREMASYFTFATLIASVVADGATFGNTGALTSSKRLLTMESAADMEAIVHQIRTTIRDMQEYSNAYTSGDYTTATNKAVLTLAIDATLYDDIKTEMGDKFHTEMLELEKLGVKVDVRNLWALNNKGASKNEIIVKTENTPAKVGGDDVTAMKISNLAWVLYHDYSAGCTRFNERVKTQPIDAKEQTNMFFKADYAYRVNVDFPCIVCTNNGTSDVTLLTE